MSEFNRAFKKQYGDYSFSLTNMERGVISPKENIAYPEFYIDMTYLGGASCIGKVYFDEINCKSPKVFYLPDVAFSIGFDVELIGCLNKYINFLQKNYKLIKINKL